MFLLLLLLFWGVYIFKFDLIFTFKQKLNYICLFNYLFHSISFKNLKFIYKINIFFQKHVCKHSFEKTSY